MHAMAADIETYLQEPGAFRLRGVVAAVVVALHVGLIAWLFLPSPPPAKPEAGTVQMIFIPPPQPDVVPPTPPKVEKPPVLTAKRHAEPAPDAPVIPPDPVPDAPVPDKPVQEAAPVAPPAPPAPPAPAEIPVDVRAAYANNPQPAYPSTSRRLNEQGVSRLRVLVGPDGRVQQIMLDRSSGFSRLDQAAMAAVRDWKFAPARRGDGAFATWVIVPINFKLEK